MFLNLIILGVVARDSVAADMEGNIAGGNVSSIEHAPHAVHIFVGAALCGASILNQIVLLTAAHCVKNVKNPSVIGISAGTTNSIRLDLNIHQLASGVAIHANYSQNIDEEVDIAVIKIPTPLIFSDKIKRVVIMRNPPFASEASLYGWGRDENGHRSANLKVAKQLVISGSDCKKKETAWRFCGRPDYNDTNPGYGRSGDSGSALIIQDYIQIGIVIFEHKQTHENGYMNVSYFYDWLAAASQILHCNNTGSVIYVEELGELEPTMEKVQ